VDTRLLNVPKSLVGKKASEPNMIPNVRQEKLRKSNSQPVIGFRRSADMRGTKGKKRDDETGFLDRAFENAAFVFDEHDPNPPRTESSDSSPQTSAPKTPGSIA